MTGFPLQIEPAVRRRLAAAGVAAGDVDEQFVRGTGPGGQKINKTSSTVWLRHRPSGLEVRCQAGRSQAANRATAWAELCAKLEGRIQARAAARQDEQARELRRHRQKSRGQKLRMIEAKRRRAAVKSGRGRVAAD